MMGRVEARERRLFVSRQFSDRSIHPVAQLTLRTDGASQHFEFTYLESVREIPEFTPFLAFPEVDRRYESETLFPFFENRIMSRNRPDYSSHLRSLDLDLDAEPFEILARTSGHRETDAIEVFPEPERDSLTGDSFCRFFVRGLRYHEGAFEAAGELKPGMALMLVPEPSNAVDPTAIIVTDERGRRLGYVPRYLTDFVANAMDVCPPDSVRLIVEHIGGNDAGRHVRLMVRFECCWRETKWPFLRSDLRPIALQRT